jgi:predicted metal-dependent hydrolase
MTPRVPEVDWSRGFERHWNGGNAGSTHAFNALSFLFPQAERYFIEVARENARSLDLDHDPALFAAVKNFVAQESIHTQQHLQYNAILRAQGFENVVQGFVERTHAMTRRSLAPITRLAVVCAYEHYTAILGNFILRNPEAIALASPDMALVWGWHSAEETEHKSVCFDLYRAAGGGWLRRVLVFLLVTLDFHVTFDRLYFSLLLRDGGLHPSRLLVTTGQVLKFFLGRTGVAWHLIGHGVRYLSPWFHPWNLDNRSELRAWLAAHEHQFRLV